MLLWAIYNTCCGYMHKLYGPTIRSEGNLRIEEENQLSAVVSFHVWLILKYGVLSSDTVMTLSQCGERIS